MAPRAAGTAAADSIASAIDEIIAGIVATEGVDTAEVDADDVEAELDDEKISRSEREESHRSAGGPKYGPVLWANGSVDFRALLLYFLRVATTNKNLKKPKRLL